MTVLVGGAVLAGVAGLLTIVTTPTRSITVAEWFNEPFIVGASLLIAGIVGWRLRPASRIGPMLCVAAMVSWIPYAQDSRVSVLASGAYALREVWVAVLIQIVLSYPTGRLSRVERVIAVLAYAKVLVPNLASALLLALPPPLDHRSFFHVTSNPKLVSATNHAVNTWAGYAISLAIAAAVVMRVARGTRVSRAAALPVLVGSSLTLLYFTFRDFTCGGFLAWSDGADTLAHVAIPFAFVTALSRGRVARGRMGGLLIDIGDAPSGIALRDALVRALGDPTLSLAYWVESEQRWIDPDGNAVALPEDGVAGRAVSYLERDGVPAAALIHDAALRDEPERLEPVRRAVRLLLDNERLTAEVRSRLVEVQASRRRILEAADEARARVQRDLHDGAQQRLVALALNLRLAQRTAPPESALVLDEFAQEVEAALQELRALARGLHPSILTESGLAAAVQAAARLCPVPASVDVDIAGRYPAAVEATAYYVVTEGLTNVAKYAQASAAQVTLFEANGSVWVEIRDDGIGGATIGAGTGLSGLRDRVEASGGALIVESPPEGGTRLVAQVPVAVPVGWGQHAVTDRGTSMTPQPARPIVDPKV